MFVNIKYLVITVISIFLALGIGILIGIQIDSQDIILEQQEITVQRMESKFEELNNVNMDLRNQLEQLSTSHRINEDYIKNIFPDYVRDKLFGLHIVIIETSDDYTYISMRQALKMAGAQVTSITLIGDRLLYMSHEEKNQLKEYYDCDNITSAILGEISRATTGTHNNEGIAFLLEKNIIYVNGDLQIPADYVVIAGGGRENSGKCEIIDIPLIKEMKKLSLPIIGVETTIVENSYIEHYKKEKLSTIDNVDTFIGQTSLILVMNGKEGHFGIKKSANSLMPFMNEGDKNR